MNNQQDNIYAYLDTQFILFLFLGKNIKVFMTISLIAFGECTQSELQRHAHYFQ